MTEKDLNKLVKQRDDLIAYVNRNLETKIKDGQRAMLDIFSRGFADLLQTDENGKILNNSFNRNLITSVDKLFSDFGKKNNVEVLASMVAGVNSILDFNNDYYSFGAKPAELLPLKKKVIEQTRGWLGIDGGTTTENGYLSTLIKSEIVKNQIKDFALKSVTGQQGWADAKRNLQTLIDGDKDGSLGALQKYHRNFAYDLFSQVDRATAKTYADDLKFEFAIYEGGLIETSREFCKKHNGNVYHKSEIMEFDPKVAKQPNYNPFTDLGGYGCRHTLNWIPNSLAFIMRPDAKKFVQGAGATPPEPQPKQVEQKQKTEPAKQTEGKQNKFSHVTKPKDFKDEVKNMFGIAKKVTFSGDGYDTEKMQKTLSHLDKLTSEYPMQAVSINEVKFKSGVGKFGSVSYSTLRNEVAVFNVGNRTDSLKNRTYNSEDFAKNFKRYKSVVDEENNDLTTTTHEFAHLITTQSRGGKTDEIKQFWTDVREIKREYHGEINELIKDGKIKEASKIFLGEYASENADEFLAESFTEYKLRSKPSKYAEKVGKLFDKYFKK